MFLAVLHNNAPLIFYIKIIEITPEKLYNINNQRYNFDINRGHKF